MNIAYIPVRGGSKSIPLKNIKSIAGKPLVYWAVSAACECGNIDRVYVVTDSDAISSAVSQFKSSKIEVIGRSEESATDTASTELGMLEFAQCHDFANIILVQATSPLVTAGDLQNGFALFSQKGVDSVVSVVKQDRFLWRDSLDSYAVPLNYDYLHRPRRQDFNNGLLIENGAFYITSKEALLSSGCRISGNIKTALMPPESYIELDEPEDWLIVEALLKRRKSAIELPIIKMFLTDCDGTLTDGGMYYSLTGEVMKKFNTRDGVGLRLLREHGIITGIITGEVSEIVCKRAEKLGVNELLLGINDKAAAISDLCAKYGVDKQNVAYIGDDLNDIEAVLNCGLGIVVGNAVKELKAVADYVTNSPGGEGAVREAVEYILDRGTYAKQPV